MPDLSVADQNFLLELVMEDGGSSDYHDGVDGWPNWSLKDDILTVKFTSGELYPAERTTMTGRWRLTYIDGESSLGDE